MSQYRTVADFALNRGTAGRYDAYLYNFLAPQIGATSQDSSDWVSRYIEAQDYDSNPDLDIGYSVSLARQAMAIFSVFLQDGSGTRYTDMRLWELIVDNWVAEGGTADNLRYIGLADIVNNTIVRQIKREIGDQVSQGKATRGQEQVTVEPGCITWRDNPFIRACEKVARSLSEIRGQSIYVAKAHLTWTGQNSLDGGENLYMVVELGRNASAPPASNAQGVHNDPRTAPNARNTNDQEPSSTQEPSAPAQNGPSGSGGQIAPGAVNQQNTPGSQANRAIHGRIRIQINIRDDRAPRESKEPLRRVGWRSRVVRRQLVTRRPA